MACDKFPISYYSGFWPSSKHLARNLPRGKHYGARTPGFYRKGENCEWQRESVESCPTKPQQNNHCGCEPLSFIILTNTPQALSDAQLAVNTAKRPDLCFTLVGFVTGLPWAYTYVSIYIYIFTYYIYIYTHTIYIYAHKTTCI